MEHRAHLWTSILNANGFRPSFADWWTEQCHASRFGILVPAIPPDYQLASLLCETFELVVRDFEGHLKAQQKYKKKLNKVIGLGSLYAAVRRDPPDPITVLCQSKQETVQGVDSDTVALEFEGSVDFRADFPLMHQGRDLAPVVVSEDKVWCEHVDGVEVGDTVVQTVCTGKLRTLFEAFHAQWKGRWLKHRSVEPSQWTQILDFARATLSPIHAPEPALSPEVLRRLIRGKSRKSACGLDGVSVLDLQAADEGQLTSLASLYSRAEADGSWPVQCMAGSVQCLAKTDNPQQPGDYRPVTVLSLVYRLWSSHRSKHWLKALGPHLDQHLCGNRPGHCPADVWRLVLNEVSDAHMTDQVVCGFVVDLVKAYNTLPRYPVLFASKLLGIGQSTLLGWSGALASVCRHFAIRSSYSDGLYSTTGLPEGCGLSCLGMLVLDLLLHRWMSSLHGSIQTLSFVDNWEVLLRNPELLDAAFDRLSHFVTLLDLELDTRKTFFWSTSRPHRVQLRSAGRFVRNSVKDLGAHVAYSKQLSNHYLTPRILALASFWDRLSASPGSHSQRVRVILTAAWPRAFHACSAAIIGRRFMDTVRTTCLRALHLDKPGASTWLQFAVEPDGVDPSLYVVWSTLRDYRSDRAAILSPPQSGECFSPFLPGSLGEIMVQRVHSLGWRILDEARVEDLFGQFDLRAISLQELSLRVHHAWTLVVAQKVRHRGTLSQFHLVDRSLTRLGLLSLSDYDQGIVRRHLNGTMITNQTTCYWSDNGSSACHFCGEVDSAFHRLWTCPGSSGLREKLPAVLLDHVGLMPQVLTVHGWTLSSPWRVAWVQALLALPSGIPKSPSQLVPGQIVDLFIDGSCLWQDVVQYRLASWAVVLSRPPSAAPSFGDCTVLCASPLTGLIQTSYRAELMALRVALHIIAEAGVLARVWTDCASVLSRFAALTQGDRQLQPNSPHADLWREVLEAYARCVPKGFQLLKVAAHRNVSEAKDPFDLWTIVGNATVDEAAKRANADRPETFWRLWERHAAAVERNKQLAIWVRQHIVQVGTLWTTMTKKPQDEEEMHPPRVKRRLLPPKVWCGHGPIRVVGRGFTKIFGAEMQDRLVQWIDQLWDDDSVVQWISFAQLYVLFQLQTGHKGVVKRKGQWLFLDHTGGETPEQFRFSWRCKGFRLMLQALFKSGHQRIHTCTTRPFSQYLLCFVGCIALPLKSTHHEILEQWFGDNLVRPIRGGSTNLDLPSI